MFVGYVRVFFSLSSSRPTLTIIVMTILSSFGCTLLCEAMANIPGNEEFEVLVSLYFLFLLSLCTPIIFYFILLLLIFFLTYFRVELS